ncbi:MAG: zinc ribbon domain-containing protein [Verrucomicrobia bacterium]|nr:zinc ribbon domain-containing protein [Verrucomicrobiota bacterium]
MPIYEFHCGQCGRDSEVLVRTSHWQGTECPHCGSTKLAKKLSVFAAGKAGNAVDDMPSCTGNPMACGRCGSGGGEV